MTELTALNLGGVVDVSLDGGFREVRLTEQDLKVQVGFVLSSSEGQLKDPREVDVASAIVLSCRPVHDSHRSVEVKGFRRSRNYRHSPKYQPGHAGRQTE